MNAPFIWIVLPFAVSIVLIFFRRKYQLTALTQTAFCLVLVFLLLVTRISDGATQQTFAININPTLNILGRSFEFADSDRFIIGIFYGVLAAWSAVLLILNKHSKIIPLGLSLTSLLLSAIAVQPFLYSALIIEIAVIIGGIITVDLQTGKSKGIIRALIFYTIGMIFILLSGWYLTGGETSPVNDIQLVQATVLMGFGFVLWLGIFPFHSWLPLIAEESETQDGFFVLAILPYAILVILLKYLNGFVWLRDYALVYQALLLFGLAMVFTGAVWTTFEKNLHKMVGYLSILFSGLILIALGLNTSLGFQTFANLLLPRFLSMFLLMISMLAIEEKGAYTTIQDLKSLFYKMPVASFGFILSIFSMTGMPMTVGFLPVLYLYQEAAKNNILITGLVLGSIALLSIAFLRVFVVIMQPIGDEFDTVSILENLKKNKFLAAVIFIVVLAGLIPNLLFPGFSQIIKSFGFLAR